ncbi:putative ammonium transporter sll0108 [Arthrobacter sp. Hiyo8]|nr:putative ammonium transporter sll0108 [Arthrobacter sp. Hiyo8]
MSGIIGTVAIGFLATPTQGPAGLFYGGGTTQLVAQSLAALCSIVFTGVMTFIIAYPIHKLMGFRISERQEIAGADLSLHAETAYEFGVGGHGGSFQPLHDLITGKVSSEAADEASVSGKESVQA